MKLLILSLLTFLSIAAIGAEKSKDIVDPEVVSKIEGMGKFIKGLEKFTVSSNSSIDIVLETGQKVQFNTDITYKVQRPDKFFVEIKSSSKHRQYFFNGENLTIFAPDTKFYTVLKTKGNISEIIDEAQKHNIEMPLIDLVDWNSDRARQKKVTSAVLVDTIGEGEKAVDHFAIRQEDIDWQVWLPQSDKYLPQKVIYEKNNEPARPQFVANLNWNINPKFNSSIFKFTPPKDSFEIELMKAPSKTKVTRN